MVNTQNKILAFSSKSNITETSHVEREATSNDKTKSNQYSNKAILTPRDQTEQKDFSKCQGNFLDQPLYNIYFIYYLFLLYKGVYKFIALVQEPV